MVQIGKDAMESLDDIDNPTGRMEAISITPVLQGAGGGAGRIFAGIGLIAAAIVLGPIGAAIGLTGGATFAAGTGVATAIGFIGASLVLSGTAQLLSPTISDNPGTFGATSPTRQRARDSFTPENNEIADNRASYIFNGAVNLTAQGNPVPLLYGRMRAGSVVVSAGLSTEDI
jgi:predicted phage tail protein